MNPERLKLNAMSRREELKRNAEGSASETPAKSRRIDLDIPATEPSSTHASLSAVGNWIGALLHFMAVAKNGDEVDVCVCECRAWLEQEVRLAKPYLWDRMMKEMGSMKSFDVYDEAPTAMKSFDFYDEVPTAQCSQEQIDNALDRRWVEVWKTDTELRCRFVARGCLQDTAKMDDDALFASTPSLVTIRILLAVSLARNWAVTLCD